jgi:hypothetical protein
MERTLLAADRGHPVWNFLLLALFAWQGWMTLTLFGPDGPWETLLDDRPVISGIHALHLYHAYLGAQALGAVGRSTCYDPDFQAGYPRTPVFDGGSRPGVLFLLLAGGDFRPAAYKVGLAVVCLLIPLLLAVACWGAGLSRPATFLATAAGLLVWWGDPSRLTLEVGEVELLLAGAAVLAHVCLLLRYDHNPGPAAWLGLLLTGCLGWFAHPLLFPFVLPLLLVYYLSVGVRQTQLSWHMALLAAEAGGMALNSFWLTDWVTHWWIRSPLPHREDTLRHRTLQTFWDAPLWGDPADRALAVLLLGSALVGVVMFNQGHRRAAARVLGLGATLLLGLALLGISWEPLGRMGTAGLLVPALWFAALPAAHAWARGFTVLAHLTGRLALAAWAGAALALAAVVVLQSDVVTLARRCAGTTPLQVGLGPEREALVEVLKERTGPEARILWEDRAGPRTLPRWTALLPHLTGRPFVGGLDPDGTIAHSHAGFVRQRLAGRDIATWTDDALQDYCWRYNVGWVVAWSPAAVARFRDWKGGAVEVAVVRDGEPGCLFRVRRQRPASYALKGEARLVHADSRHMSFADVVPEDGRVVLSFHYQPGMRASPSRVQIEREPDPGDDIPFVRLRVNGPVARVTLTWEDW